MTNGYHKPKTKAPKNSKPSTKATVAPKKLPPTRKIAPTK